MTLLANGVSRRRFLQTLGAGGAIGTLPWLAGCGGAGPASDSASEQRTLYFNLRSPMAGSSYHLLVGRREHELTPVQEQHLTAASSRGGRLAQRALAGDITHVAEAVTLPAGAPPLMFVRGRNAALQGKLHLHSLYLHAPRGGAPQSAARSPAAPQSTARSPAAPRSGACCAPAAAAAAENFWDEYNDFLSYYEMARSVVALHPEICCFDAGQLDYIFTNYLCSNPNFENLAESIYDQGDAMVTPGGWATLVAATDPATGAPLTDSQGEPLYTMVYSDTTRQLTAVAIASVLRQIKDDRQLGANVTSLDPTVANAGLQGKLWLVHDGSPTALAAAGSGPVSAAPSAALGAGAPRLDQTQWAFALGDVSAHAGYSIDSIAGDGRSAGILLHRQKLVRTPSGNLCALPGRRWTADCPVEPGGRQLVPAQPA